MSAKTSVKFYTSEGTRDLPILEFLMDHPELVVAPPYVDSFRFESVDARHTPVSGMYYLGGTIIPVEVYRLHLSEEQIEGTPTRTVILTDNGKARWLGTDDRQILRRTTRKPKREVQYMYELIVKQPKFMGVVLLDWIEEQLDYFGSTIREIGNGLFRVSINSKGDFHGTKMALSQHGFVNIPSQTVSMAVPKHS